MNTLHADTMMDISSELSCAIQYKSVTQVSVWSITEMTEVEQDTVPEAEYLLQDHLEEDEDELAELKPG